MWTVYVCDTSLSYLSLTHLPLRKMAAISLTTFSNAFSWMKSFVFRFRFHWSLFLRVQLTISQQWVNIIYCLGPNWRPSVAIHWWDMQELTGIALNKKSDWRLAFWDITITSQWVGWHLKSPASRLLALTLVQAQNVYNMKAPRHWSLWGESIPNKGPVTRKCFNLMTSLWIRWHLRMYTD